MPDSIEASPPAPPAQNDEPALSEWSPESVAKAFDQVTPATAGTQKPAPAAPPTAPVPPVPPTAPEPPVPPVPPTPPPSETKSILPEELFGEIPKAKAAEPESVVPEVDAPESVKSNPEAFKNWKELRTGYDQRGKELEKVRLELNETKSKMESGVLDEGVKARLTQLEEENKTFKERQYAIDLQSDPEFQKVFIHGRRRLVDGGATILKEAGLDPDTFQQAMELNGRAKTEALDEIIESVTSPTVRGELTAIIKDVNSLDRSKHQALADSKGTVEKLRQNSRAQEFKALQEHTKFLDSTVDTVVDRLGNVSKIGFFRKIEGNDEWNKQVDEIISDTRDIVKNSTDFGQLTTSVALGRAAIPMYNALVSLNRELQKARQEIADFKGAEPGFNGQRKQDTGEPTELPKNLTFAEAAAQRSGLR